jgi:CHASE2 domain-containing sensor protein
MKKNNQRLGTWPKAVGFGALLCGLIYAAFWVHLLNFVGVDNWFERQFFKLASHTVEGALLDNIRLIYIDEKDNGPLGGFSEGTAQGWRTYHAELLRKLADAHAKVVAFDLSFPAPEASSEIGNKAFIDAVSEVRAAGATTVIAGYERNMDPNVSLERVLPREEMGLISVSGKGQGPNSDSYLTKVLIAESDISETAVGSLERLARPLPMGLALYLATMQKDSQPSQPLMDASDSQVQLQGGTPALAPIDVEVQECTQATINCPLAEGATLHRRALLPFWIAGDVPFVDRSYLSVYAQKKLGEDYAGKTVLIGARTGSEAVTLGPGAATSSTVYGYQVHARVLTDLLSRTYPRAAPHLWQFLGMAILLTIGALARVLLPRSEVTVPIGMLKDFPIPLGLLIVAAIYIFATVLVFRSTHVLFDLGYQLLALFAGYYAVGRLLAAKDPRAAQP